MPPFYQLLAGDHARTSIAALCADHLIAPTTQQNFMPQTASCTSGCGCGSRGACFDKFTRGRISV
jgi:hypothetical protein